LPNGRETGRPDSPSPERLAANYSALHTERAMHARFAKLGLPMLAKELAEMAQRRRTYGIRAAFAVLLFSMSALVCLPDYLAARSSPRGLLGQGRQLLDVLYVVEWVGLCLFVPAVVSGALAAEKERNTLQLLFVTRLGPWTILIEKLLSRLVPVATFLLISMPILLIGYLMGGLTPQDLAFVYFGLAATAFQVACISLFCSAFCATSAMAFAMSYVMTAALFILPYFVVATYVAIETACKKLFGGLPPLFTWLDQPGFQPAVRVAMTSTHGFSADWLFRQGAGPGPPRPFHRQILPLCLIASSGLVFLLLARVVIVSRLAPQPKYRIRRLFRWLDRAFVRINDRFGKGIVFGRTGSDLPEDNPIAWRENRRGNLGRFNHLIRIVLAIELPVLFPTIFYVLTTRDLSFSALVIPGMLLWSIAFLIVMVRAAGLVAGEKARQTLDVLLTTPLPIAELAGEKVRGMRRTMLVVSAPILFHALLVEFLQRNVGQLYLLQTAVNLVILLNLATQLAFLFGLKARTQGRAVTAVLGVFAGWCLIPVVVRVFANSEPWTLYLSPVGGLLASQFPELGRSRIRNTYFGRLPESSDFYAVIHAVIYAAIVGTLVLINRGLARRALNRPRTFSRAHTHHRGLFVED
jgi:ABC-type transport system involved in multi-copper enzyme maturation permease subunit